MKFTLSLSILLLLAVSLSAQSRRIMAEEYDKVFKFAVSETNAAFPFTFTVTTDFIEDGKIVRTATESEENEAKGRRRITRTIIEGGSTTRTYQVSMGFGKVYCSDDGINWKAPSPYECSGPVSFYGPRNPESVEYKLLPITLAGVEAKLYRQYSVFASSTPGGKKSFQETLSTIDSRGFFLSIVTVEGTLDPRKVTLVRKQIWDAKTKIKPIVAPGT